MGYAHSSLNSAGTSTINEMKRRSAKPEKWGFGRTPFASKEAAEEFAKKFARAIGKEIRDRKKPGVRQGDGMFWEKMRRAIVVTRGPDGVYGPVNSNYSFDIGLNKRKRWRKTALWKAAFLKEYGGLQKPKESKGIPIPTSRGRLTKRASEVIGDSRYQFRPIGARGQGVPTSRGMIIGYVEFHGDPPSATVYAPPARVVYIVYRTYKHLRGDDQWMPSSSAVDAIRAKIVKKVFSPRGALRGM